MKKKRTSDGRCPFLMQIVDEKGRTTDGFLKWVEGGASSFASEAAACEAALAGAANADGTRDR
jgi:hypothetical protein